MENGKDNRLDQVLASYGAESARWPASDRGGNRDLTDAAAAEAREIDRVLGLASVPELPEGAAARLMARIGSEKQITDTPAHDQADVILFRPRARQSTGWLRVAAALPLAASLALGVYLGAAGTLDPVLPTAVTGSVATVDDTIDDLGGVGEADAYAEESLT